MINANSMQTEPKGRIPPIQQETRGSTWSGTGGTTRAIWLIFVGISKTSCFNPKKLPINTNGVLTQAQSKKILTMVKKETAVAAPAMPKKTFKIMNMATKHPGRPRAVRMAFCFHCLPPAPVLTRSFIRPPSPLARRTFRSHRICLKIKNLNSTFA